MTLDDEMNAYLASKEPSAVAAAWCFALAAAVVIAALVWLAIGVMGLG